MRKNKKKTRALCVILLFVLFSCNSNKEILPEINTQCLEEYLQKIKTLLKESAFGDQEGMFPYESVIILESAIDEIENGLSKAKAGIFILQYEPDNYCINAIKAIENFHNTFQEKIDIGEPSELVVYGLNGGKIDFGDDPAYNFSEKKFTLETWVKFENGFIDGPMPTLLATFADYGGVYEGWSLNIMGDLLRFSIACKNGLHELGTPYPKIWGQWYHLAVTFEESATSNRIKMYLNGKMVASHNGGEFKPITNNNKMWAFQEPYTGIYKGLSGYMKKIRMWNSVKSIDEINELMYADVSGMETDLLCAWDFNVVPDNDDNIPSIKDGNRFKASLSGSYKWKKINTNE